MRMMVRAIARHARTFAGRSAFSVAFELGLVLRLSGSPICRYRQSTQPVCRYPAATFERVFRAMFGPQLRACARVCAASGAASCEFDVSR